jgi:hypothetical protein
MSVAVSPHRERFSSPSGIVGRTFSKEPFKTVKLGGGTALNGVEGMEAGKAFML